MGNQNMLSILNNAYVICLVLAISFLVLSVVLFFILHIRDVANELSGKARKAATRKMEENYSVTGSLRQTESSPEIKGLSEKLSYTSGGLFLTGNLKKQTDNKDSTDNFTTTLNKKPPSTKLKDNSSEKSKSSNNVFKITKDVVIIHTQEKIG